MHFLAINCIDPDNYQHPNNTQRSAPQNLPQVDHDPMGEPANHTESTVELLVTFSSLSVLLYCQSNLSCSKTFTVSWLKIIKIQGAIPEIHFWGIPSIMLHSKQGTINPG